MFISIPWALALAGSGVASALLLVAWRSRGSLPLVDSLLHLLAGGLAGFLAIAFYPAWPMLAAIIGMLIIRAARAGRGSDIGLLVTGLGGVWTLLLGLGIINDSLDPAVVGPDQTIPFTLGAALLIVGLVMAIGLWRPAGSTPDKQ
jgi:hypothetical protein